MPGAHPSVPRPQPLTWSSRDPSWARASEGVGEWGGHNDCDKWAQRPKLRNVAEPWSFEEPEVDVFPGCDVTHWHPNNFAASLHIWVSQAAGLSSGRKHALRREEGQGGGLWGHLGHSARQGPREGFSKHPHRRCIQGCALPTHRRRERVSAKGGDLQTGPPSHTARVSASIFCSPCKLSGSWSWATLCRMAISGPPPYRWFR